MKIKLAALALAAAMIIGMFPAPAGAAANSTTAKIIKNVNFRNQPSTSGKRIRYLKAGETVTIVSKVNAYWYKIRDGQNRQGYVSALPQYIKVASSTAASSASHQKLAQKVIDAGMKYLGTPYEFGSSRSNTRTFDCSDFVRQAFLDGMGLKLPTDSRKQGAYVKQNFPTTTNWRQLKPGDLMFFMAYKGTKASNYKGINKSKQRITHVAIYLGNGKMLQTYSQASGGVRVDSIAGKHWEYRFIFGGSAF